MNKITDKIDLQMVRDWIVYGICIVIASPFVISALVFGWPLAIGFAIAVVVGRTDRDYGTNDGIGITSWIVMATVIIIGLYYSFHASILALDVYIPWIGDIINGRG